MYKNCALVLCLSLLFTGMCTVHAKDMDFQRSPDEILHMTVSELQEERNGQNAAEALYAFAWMQNIASPERAVEYGVLVNEDAVWPDEESFEILCRIVEAEAGNEDETGRILVANVVMNRVNSSRFPDTVQDVVFQKSGRKYQFSPVATGSYYYVNVSEKTREAVRRALGGEDLSQGALYFVNRYAADAENMRWFDRKCTFLFAYGRHEFFS